MKHTTTRSAFAGRSLAERIVFLILLALASGVTFYLFYQQCLHNYADADIYHADMKAYILHMQGLDSGYSFPYPIFFKLSAFFDLFVRPELAVALATTLLNAAAMVAFQWTLDEQVLDSLRGAFPRRPYLAGVVTSLVAFSIFFVSMLYPPTGIYLPGIGYRYLGVFTANPFHNATYMAARPFAILSFFQFAKLLDLYEEADFRGSERGRLIREYVLFAIFLLLATMTKPSFTIVLVGAAGLIMVWRLIAARFRNLVPTIYLGCTFLPTFVDLLYQYSGVFVPDEGVEGGIGFSFGEVWAQYCSNLPLAIVLAVGFPLLVLILNYNEYCRDTIYRFSWQIYLMGFAMAFLLYEKGFRKYDFNFAWGYMYGIFFAFVGALIVLLRATATKKRPVLLIVQWGVYLAHLLCGLIYFYGILRGGFYY